MQALIRDRFKGNQKAFADAIKKSPSQVNQWLTDRRAISEGTARHIERSLRLPDLWMDATTDVSEIARAPNEVPVISWVQAGAFQPTADPYPPGVSDEWLPCPNGHGPRTFALRVQGDSMTNPSGRSYPQGTVIFCDPDKQVENGSRVIARIGDTATFKVYSEDAGRHYLRPLNPQYPVMEITADTEIVAVLCGSYTPE